MKNIDRNLAKTLPFDQYSRQMIVATLVNKALRPDAKAKLKIIDIGGHKGKTREFLPSDDVTILDVFDESYEGYVKGDATKIEFADETFDIAVSFDVLEHIPRPSRPAYLSEALRVSKMGVFIAVPVNAEDRKTTDAEMLLNEVNMELFGEDHRWLKEHIDLGIPSLDEMQKLLGKSGAYFVSMPSNQLDDWIMLQTLIFIASQNSLATQAVNEVNAWYNEHCLELDSGIDCSYRRIFFISKNAKMTEAVKAMIDKSLVNGSNGPGASEYKKIHSVFLSTVAMTLAKLGKSFNEVKSLSDKLKISLQNTDHQRKVAENQAAEYKKRCEMLQQELDAMKQSLSWRATKPLRKINKIVKG